MKALISQRENTDAYGEYIDTLERAYVEYFEALGVDVWPVSNFKQTVSMIFERESWDLLILTGGGSVPNDFYAEPRRDPQQMERDATEKNLVQESVRRGIPILAICRGMQFVNGLYGGKISELKPIMRTPRPIGKDHPVRLCATNEEIMVNNYHNDGIRESDLAPVFEAVAVDEKNEMVEAFISKHLKIFGMQWHPERTFESGKAQADSKQLVTSFLEEFVKA